MNNTRYYWFASDRGYLYKLKRDTPARNLDKELNSLENIILTNVDIEVFLNNRWVRGYVTDDPEEYEFTIKCKSFLTKDKVKLLLIKAFPNFYMRTDWDELLFDAEIVENNEP